jgi:hypothetical protein
MPDRYPPEFGKRRTVAPPSPQPAAKRSGHVALLVMGTLAVGGGAYALMPRESCGPTPPEAAASGMAAPALPQTTRVSCSSSSSHGSSGSGSSRSSRLSFFGNDSSSSHSSSASSDSGSGGVTRGGFGGFAHAFGFSGHG